MSKKLYLFISLAIGFAAIIAFALFVNSQGPKDTGKDRVSDSSYSITPMPTITVTPTSTASASVLKAGTNYQAVLTTSVGKITIDLFVDKTPITVNNFTKLSKQNFYDNTIFHRVINGFMIQGGDPEGNGSGGPGYKFPDEPFTGEYDRGIVAMANSGPNTNGSQFFIMHQSNQLPKNYVIFGKVTSGMETVDKIATASVSASVTGEMSVPVKPVKVISVEIVEISKETSKPTPTFIPSPVSASPSSTPKI
jgi:cyclophilin family peptidyl-prolyl cis-trans isomerase